jgi:hypothetical protein
MQNTIGFSLKQFGMYANYSHVGKNTGLQVQIDHIYDNGLPESRLKYRPYIEGDVERRRQAVIEE